MQMLTVERDRKIQDYLFRIQTIIRVILTEDMFFVEENEIEEDLKESENYFLYVCHKDKSQLDWNLHFLINLLEMAVMKTEVHVKECKCVTKEIEYLQNIKTQVLLLSLDS